MPVPCHSEPHTPSASLGADRLIGSYCFTAESEEGKLWPLPCSPASHFHIIACFSWTLSLSLHSWSSLSLFLNFLFWFHRSPLLLAHSCSFPLCAGPTSSLYHIIVSSFPLPGSSPPYICHCHSPSLFISRLYVSVYPGPGVPQATSSRSHTLLLHLLAWSPISLYRDCHLFCYIVPSLCLSRLRRPCVSSASFVQESVCPQKPSPSTPRGPVQDDFMVKSVFKVQSKVLAAPQWQFKLRQLSSESCLSVMLG